MYGKKNSFRYEGASLITLMLATACGKGYEIPSLAECRAQHEAVSATSYRLVFEPGAGIEDDPATIGEIRATKTIRMYEGTPEFGFGPFFETIPDSVLEVAQGQPFALYLIGVSLLKGVRGIEIGENGFYREFATRDTTREVTASIFNVLDQSGDYVFTSTVTESDGNEMPPDCVVVRVTDSVFPPDSVPDFFKEVALPFQTLTQAYVTTEIQR